MCRRHNMQEKDNGMKKKPYRLYKAIPHTAGFKIVMVEILGELGEEK